MREEIVSPVGGPPRVFMDDLQICYFIFVFIFAFIYFLLAVPFLLRCVIISPTRFRILSVLC